MARLCRLSSGFSGFFCPQADCKGDDFLFRQIRSLLILLKGHASPEELLSQFEFRLRMELLPAAFEHPAGNSDIQRAEHL